VAYGIVISGFYESAKIPHTHIVLTKENIHSGHWLEDDSQTIRPVPSRRGVLGGKKILETGPMYGGKLLPG
jgi:hypothetical protein